MILDRTIRWRGLDLDTIEHCHILSSDRDKRIRSAIIGPNFALFYQIKLDEDGNTRKVKIERTDGRTLELFSDGAGNWSDDRAEPVPALRGCIDVDIWPTPLTNTLPIWRTELPPGKPVAFAMVWINATDMSVKRSEQVYTRLDAERFLYQSADFEAEIETDQDGLVVEYPGLFARA